jgi:hypothetical protein
MVFVHSVDPPRWMHRALAVVLVCCLFPGTAFASASGATPRSVAGVTPLSNTTKSLTVDPNALETASYRRVTLDIPATLTLATRSLDGQFEPGTQLAVLN